MKPQRTRDNGKPACKSVYRRPRLKRSLIRKDFVNVEEVRSNSKWAVRKDVTWRESVRQVRGILKGPGELTGRLAKAGCSKHQTRKWGVLYGLRTIGEVGRSARKSRTMKVKSLQKWFSFNVSINIVKPARGWYEDKTGRTGFQRQGQSQLNANLIVLTLNPKVTYASL